MQPRLRKVFMQKIKEGVKVNNLKSLDFYDFFLNMKIRTKQFITRLRDFFYRWRSTPRKFSISNGTRTQIRTDISFYFEDVNEKKYYVESLNHKRAT